jgi:hypothetical protein
VNLAVLLFFVMFNPVMFGPGRRFQLEYSKDDFGVRSHGIIEKIGANLTKFYRVPQSTRREYIQLRPEDLRINPLPPDDYDRQEVIGPYQIEDGKIWFGKRYYDGEGSRGVGAFGYFDTSTLTYTLFSPREVARYEVSAILVQPETVWIALDRFGEDISTSPGGLVCWNRVTRQLQQYPLEFVVKSIRMEEDRLRLKTREGYALFRNGELRRFLTNGRSIAKFPPPPTHN